MILLLLGCKPEPEPPAPEPVTELLLIADTGHGRLVLVDRNTAQLQGDLCVSAQLPEECQDPAEKCLLFEVAHELVDDQDLLTVSYGKRATTGGIPGGVVELGGDTATVRVGVLRYPEDPDLDASCQADPTTDDRCRLTLPHVQVEMGDNLVVADTLNNRVVFVDPDNNAVAVIGREHPENPGARYPNAVQLVDDTHLLTTYKGGGGEYENGGRLILWDVTDPTDAHLVWAWPEGFIAAPHAASVQTGPDGPLLLWAHAFGASADADNGDLGSVGVATWNGYEPPDYLGDVVLPEDDAFGFVRDVELVDGGTNLLVTDSGCENQEAECGREARVVTIGLPALDSELSGAWTSDHAGQAFVESELVGRPFAGILKFPFEADLVLDEAWGASFRDPERACE